MVCALPCYPDAIEFHSGLIALSPYICPFAAAEVNNMPCQSEVLSSQLMQSKFNAHDVSSSSDIFYLSSLSFSMGSRNESIKTQTMIAHRAAS
jgi:hypothetical protein